MWVLVDVTTYLDKLVVRKERALKKSVKMLIDKEFGVDFAKHFDLVFDMSQITNLGLFGSRVLQAQDNYILEAFLGNLEYGFTKRHNLPKNKLMFDFKDLKCGCKVNAKKAKCENFEQGGMSVGQTFIQSYYLSQRKLHSEAERAGSVNLESTKITLNDILKVKRLADNINFLRLYFLESPDKYVRMRSEGMDSGIEIIDCILSIFLFEITRATRSDAIYSQEQLSYKVLKFF